MSRRFVFVHINKTAGISIERALGIEFTQHFTIEELRQKFGSKVFENTFKFSFVRNPWDKVVSHYEFRTLTNKTGLKDHPLSFKEWVNLAYNKKDPKYYNNPKMFMPQVDWLTDDDGKIAVDFIGRFERLQEDFDEVCDQIGLAKKKLTHQNRSRNDNSDYRAYYDEQTEAIVRNYFQRDCEVFGYRF